MKIDNDPFAPGDDMTTVTYEELRPAPCKNEAPEPEGLENTIEGDLPSEIPPPKKNRKQPLLVWKIHGWKR